MQSSLNKKHKKILEGSIFVSLCFHAAALFFLQNHSVWFSPVSPPEAESVPWLSSMEKAERDLILKEAFQTSSASESQKSVKGAKPQAEILSLPFSKTDPSFPIEGGTEILATLTPPNPFPPESLLASNQILSFPLPSEERINLFEHLPKDLILLTSPKLTSAAPPLSLPPLSALIAFAELPPPVLPEAPSPTITHDQELPPPPSWTEKSNLAKIPSFIPAPNLPNIPSLSELQTHSHSNNFDADLVFSPDDQGGYIFALTLIPRPDLNLTPIRQNYFFLIDRSNSIQRERLMATKNAVRKAIEDLGGDDTFNIIAFDNKLEKLSPISLSPSSDSLKKASDFLDKIDLGSFFSQSDLFKALFLTIPTFVKEDELYTAIVVTDGENLGRKEASQSLLNDWSRYNDGRVALYTLGMGGDPYLAVLDTASAFNKGKLLTSPTKRGLKRKLLKLMKTIHSPVSKSLSCKAISRTPQGAIDLLPKGTQAPHLYLNEPYVIMGRTNSLDDFILFVQGRLNGEWLHIKKTISFLNGKKGNSSLKAQWALQKAYELYGLFLIEGDPKYIAEARSLLEPHDLQVAIE